MAVVWHQNVERRLSLLSGRACSARSGGVKGASLLDAAERVLDNEDRSAIIQRVEKAPLRGAQGSSPKVAPSSLLFTPFCASPRTPIMRAAFRRSFRIGCDEYGDTRSYMNDTPFGRSTCGQDLVEYVILMAFVALAATALFLGAGAGVWQRSTGYASAHLPSPTEKTLAGMLRRPASQDTENAICEALESIYASSADQENACSKILQVIIDLREDGDYGKFAMSRELARRLARRSTCTAEFQRILNLPESTPIPQ